MAAKSVPPLPKVIWVSAGIESYGSTIRAAKGGLSIRLDPWPIRLNPWPDRPGHAPSQPISVQLETNGRPIAMEDNTGVAVSLVSERTGK